MRVDYSKRFIKHLQKAPDFIQSIFEKKFELFLADKHHQLLNIHALRGEWQGFLSMNITGDWRAIFHWIDEEKVEWVEFVEIGTHSELYG